MNKKDIIHQEAKELLDQLGFHTAIEVVEAEGVYTISIKTEEDAPMMIGKFGETLNALQRVLEAIIYNQCKEKVELVVNVNDYREKQVERLEGIAENAAVRAREEHQVVPLRSFSAYERKIMHEYIARAHPDLASYSEGEGADRMIMIAPKKEEK